MMKRIKQLMCFLTILIMTFVAFIACGDDNNGSPTAEVIIPESYKTLNFTKLGGNQSVSIQSSVDLVFTSTASWLIVEKETSTSQKICKVKVTCATNDASSARTAFITITAIGFCETISVVQAAGDELTLISGPTQIKALSAGDNYTVTVTASATPQFTADVFWISTAGPIINSDDSYTFTITINQNYTIQARQGAITISNGEVSFTINVLQEGGESFDGIKAVEIAKLITTGINIGNTLEATGGEGSWNAEQAIVNNTYLKALKDAGFNAVRIPCAWSNNLQSTGDYGANTIKTAWMDRVTEVVDMALANGLFVILNIHWDGGWLEDNINGGCSESINTKQFQLWEQIAKNFKEYDSRLLFAGTNEPGMNEHTNGGWTQNHVNSIMIYEKTFIETVRHTGSKNAVRVLIVQGPGASIEQTVSASQVYNIPADPAGAGYMMAEVHYYEPYQFCLMEDDASWGKVALFWGADYHVTGTNSNRNSTWGEEAYLKEQFNNIKTKFVDNGIPVIIGEYAAKTNRVQKNITKAIYELSDDEYAKHKASVAYFDGCVAKYAKQRGCIGFLWECGETFNRKTGAIKRKDIVDAIMQGVSEVEYPY